MLLRFLLLALGIDAGLVSAAVAWWLYIGPALRLPRYVGRTDPDHPRFTVTDGMLLPTPSNTYLLARFSLRPGEAWEIAGQVPSQARYYSLTLYGPRGRSFDYRRGQRITLHDEQLVYDDPAQRTFRVFISTEDRAYPNWLDCSQRGDGLVMIRQNGVVRADAIVPAIAVHRHT